MRKKRRFKGIDDRVWLKMVQSYIRDQINPKKCIPLDHLSSLNVEDLDCVTEDMFEYIKWDKETLTVYADALSNMCTRMEKENRNNI